MNIRSTFLLILLVLLSSVNVTQYYVSTTGLVTNKGVQTYFPFLSIKKAIQTTFPNEQTKLNLLRIIIIINALALTPIFIIMKKLENQKNQQTLIQNYMTNRTPNSEHSNLTSPNKVEN